ncbi:MAG: hypothetical protein IJ123_07790 [Blautia sp.]|nr:hypothetical protein [Blautia sp.]
MKKCTLEDLLGKRIRDSYDSQYRYICGLLNKGEIKPVKSSPGNGKKPALYTMYWLIEEKPDYSEWKEELLYRTDPQIDVDYYINHLDAYDRDRDYVRRLSDFLQKDSNKLSVPVSGNERSFEIWGEEKYLTGGFGRRILKRCGIEEETLNIYNTAEPFAYFALHRKTPQKLLIVENKDPFFGMRRFLLEGNKCLLGAEIGTLIYGAGKRVNSCFREFGISAEPYMKSKGNELLYFGDLDYEGIMIYETLAEAFSSEGQISPFIPAYLAMLDKGDLALTLPYTKEHQNRNNKGLFFSFFDETTLCRMKNILESGRYIPQEILNASDYLEG